MKKGRQMKAAIMGYGTIGSGVAETLRINHDVIARRVGEPVELAKVLDVREFEGDPVQPLIVHDYKDIVNDPEIRIVVETMGGVEPAYTFVKAMLEAGKHVTTSNKALVADKGAELIQIAKEHNVNFMFEASVGGGIPIIRSLQSCLTGDVIEYIAGIVNGTTNYMMTEMADKGADFDDVLKEAQPDVVLVHGDTTTSTAAALAAFYQRIPVGHVEAGLRTYQIYSPWPEEMNRQITSRIARYNFAPTPLSRENLLREYVDSATISVTGNTVIDALHMVVQKLKDNPALSEEQRKVLLDAGYDVRRLERKTQSGEGPRRLVLITGHRRENFGLGFMHICHAIKSLTQRYPDVDFVYPMHLNPNVRKPIHEIFDGIDMLPPGKGWGEAFNMFFIEPLEYLSFVYLMEKSTLVLTDSGGIQEEAPGLGKPVLVMRDTTERPEALESGTVHLVGCDEEKIFSEVCMLLDDKTMYDKMSRAWNPYGDGKACERIVNMLKL